MQEAQAHPSIIFHQHPHAEQFISWEDGVLLAAMLALVWVFKPIRRRGRKAHGVEREAGD